MVIPRDYELLDSITGDRSRSEALLERLVKSGWLERVRRGAYVVRSRSASLRLTAVDLVGELSPRPHLITAGRALELADLTDQSHRVIVVLTATAVRDWSWLGEQVAYVRTARERIWGGEARGSSHRPPQVASPERAILDCLAEPRWGVSLFEVVRALGTCLRRPRFEERLALAAAHYRNAAVARRIGFLTETIAGPEAARGFLALRGRSNAPTLLDPGAGTTGHVVSRWRLFVNVPLALLLEQPS